MKRFLILVLFLPIVATAQIVDSVAVGDSLTTQMDAGGSNYFSGIVIDQGVSDTLMFKVSGDGTNYVYLATSDSALYYVRVDSSRANAVTLSRDYFYPWRYLQIESQDPIASTKKAIRFIRERRR